MRRRRLPYIPADPYWITCRYDGTCNGCQAKLHKGDRAFFYPKGKALYGETCGCGEQRAREFAAAVRDEEFMLSQFPGGY